MQKYCCSANILHTNMRRIQETAEILQFFWIIEIHPKPALHNLSFCIQFDLKLI